MKTYIIRLKNNPISEKYASECVKQAKNFNIDVKFFDAINGLEYKKHISTLNIKPQYKFKKKKIGVFGCFLSHYYLWKNCVEANEAFIILEHDGYFIKPLPDNILYTFTDVLKLDTLNPYSMNYNTLIKEQINLPLTTNSYFNNNMKNFKKNGTGNYMQGAYGYIIKPHAAKHLIDWISKNGFVPADRQIGNLIVDIKVVIPTVVRLHPDYHPANQKDRIKELSLTGNPELI